jgi:hypothetical protein
MFFGTCPKSVFETTSPNKSSISNQKAGADQIHTGQ